MNNLLIALKSANSKLGDVVATYRRVGPSCPQDCALLNKGCYAQRGLTGLQSAKSEARTDDFAHILNGKRDLVRHHVTGDVFKNDKLDADYVSSLIKFHHENPRYTGWLYTHRIQAWDAAGFTADTIPSNLEVIASCDTEADVKYAVANGWKYARVTDDSDKLTENEGWCPIDRLKAAGQSVSEIKITCQSCKLCWDKQYHQLNIVFRKHTGHESKSKNRKELTDK